MIYNQKEHEKWKKKFEKDPLCILVIKSFEHDKWVFLKDLVDFYNRNEYSGNGDHIPTYNLILDYHKGANKK